MFDFSDDKIEMGKKCVINDWYFPPLDYIEARVKAEEEKNEFYREKIARLKSLKFNNDTNNDEKSQTMTNQVLTYETTSKDKIKDRDKGNKEKNNEEKRLENKN